MSDTTRSLAATPTQLRRDAEALRAALAGLVRVCQSADRGTICCHDVSVTQCYAVDALVRRDALSLNELSAELYLDKTTASRVVATLVRKGYVARKQHAQDRRAIVLRATARGRRLVETVHAEQVEALTQLLTTIEPEVRAAATTLVARLAEAVAARCFGDPGSEVCSSECATDPGAGGCSC